MSLLFSSFKIKNIELNTKLVMPPMASEKADEGGLVSQALCDYYDEKTKGSYVGLVITEHSYVSPEGKASVGQLSIADDSTIEGFKKLGDVLHKNGAKVIAQISHAGAAARHEITGYDALSSSCVKIPRKNSNYELPKEMTQNDIDKAVNDFVQAARRAKEAGFDGVEIHSAHGYLLNQFFSPIMNKRTDKYNGNSIEGRTRLHIEIIESIRKITGPDFLIAVRLGACDYVSGGSSLEDSVQACLLFKKAGVDLLDISGGFCGYTNPELEEEGWFRRITQAVKEKVDVPVILTGGIVTPEAAEKILQEGKTDLIGVGRALLKDSDWPKKAMKKLEERV
ncbi:MULTISPECIES: NADH:flavin oxidoreductase [unclassified Treponema]|uniref:NADH:flavin oxidoreductase n=1 Tax=unclassified Treponema TaxID=2638727 RepID=UPI0020A58781|nr:MULTISPECIES: NADH:flavin oxidoreductase [unclassified Treponema]UTC66335.1 NADH:flavin oxidoreductase [Treponema sp. OMZ 789]UTC69065.1 NADH:flavin oxidoreductase [Treponema sp. OMZ 790]UTC71777.1 NADH:flavin oxidoreductase [Treponema sp. OMZ 791]